jgi:hypothetical protein
MTGHRTTRLRAGGSEEYVNCWITNDAAHNEKLLQLIGRIALWWGNGKVKQIHYYRDCTYLIRCVIMSGTRPIHAVPIVLHFRPLTAVFDV